MLPKHLLDELKVDGGDPFHVSLPKPRPSVSMKFAQKPGIAVWLKTSQHQLQYMGTLSPRQTLFHPKDFFASDLLGTLDITRWTVIEICEGN